MLRMYSAGRREGPRSQFAFMLAAASAPPRIPAPHQSHGIRYMMSLTSRVVCLVRYRYSMNTQERVWRTKSIMLIQELDYRQDVGKLLSIGRETLLKEKRNKLAVNFIDGYCNEP